MNFTKVELNERKHKRICNKWFLTLKIQKLTKLHCIVQESKDVHLGGNLQRKQSKESIFIKAQGLLPAVDDTELWTGWACGGPTLLFTSE